MSRAGPDLAGLWYNGGMRHLLLLSLLTGSSAASAKIYETFADVAERAIRPVVVARKISGGSRSDNGAHAFATLASLLRTAGQQGQNLLGTIKSLLVAAWSAGNPAVVPEHESRAAR